MLYQLYEAQRSLMEPFADFAQAASKLFSSGAMFSQMPMSQRVAASYDLIYRLGKDYEKPEFDIKTVKVNGADVVIHEIVEIDKPFCQLRRFKRFTDDEQVLETLNRSGLTGRYSIIGFDDLPIASLATPRLSTMHVDREAIGEAAIRLLRQQIEGDRSIHQLELGVTAVEGGTIQAVK